MKNAKNFIDGFKSILEKSEGFVKFGIKILKLF